MRFTFLLEKKPTFWPVAAFFILSFSVSAQTATPGGIAVSRPQVNLFLHLDKSIYQPRETIWFTGYVVNRDEDLMHDQNTLYVTLIDPVGKSVVTKQRFLIRNGFGKGYLALPDSIAAGDYWLLGYTNSLLETGDQPIFRQLISVRTGEPSPFRISSAKLEEQGDSLFVRYRISTANSGLASGGKFTYYLFDSTHAISAGQKIIDPFGEVTAYLGPKQDAGKYRELSVTITRGALTKKFFFPVQTSNAFDPQASIAKARDPAPTISVKITPDSGYYRTRSKVTLHIRIRDSAGQAVPGVFSLSVVESKRLGPNQPRSIAGYDQFPATMPFAVRELKKFTGPTPDYGYVLQDDEKVKKPVKLALVGNSFASFQTDSAGRFLLPYSTLLTTEGEVNCLSVADKYSDSYKIVVVNRSDTFDKQLAAIHYPIAIPNYQIAPDPDDLIQQTSSIVLRAAVVKATIKAEMDYGNGYYNSTHCEDDFVCTHHHGGFTEPDQLNCPNMLENGPCLKVKPKEGGFYYWVPPSVAHQNPHPSIPVIYHCKVPPVPHFMKVLGPILREKPFPSPYIGKGQPLGSGLQSTVYWSHGLTTDANGEITISFYTNDLTGDFTCSLQGVSSAGLITGSAAYKVVYPDPIAVSHPAGNSTSSEGYH